MLMDSAALLMQSDTSPVRVIKQLLQSLTERCRESRGPDSVKKSDSDHIEDVNSVFESIGSELHQQKCFGVDDLEFKCSFRFFDSG